MSTDKIRLGIVGLRNNGLGHAKRAVELDGCCLAAAADVDPDRRAAAAELTDGLTTCENADELFAADDVDAVVLSLPKP